MNSIYSPNALNHSLFNFSTKNFNLEKNHVSNIKLLNLARLKVNELPKSISKKIYQYSFFHPIYHCLFKDFKSL